MALSKKAPTSFMSLAVYPLVVTAGVPILTPPGVTADLSPIIVFLFKVICTASQAFSNLDPVKPKGLTSRRSKWFSVPLVTSLCPLLIKSSAKVLALSLTCLAYALNSGVLTYLSWAHKAAI